MPNSAPKPQVGQNKIESGLQWEAVCELLKAHIPTAPYRDAIEPLRFIGFSFGHAIINIEAADPTQFQSCLGLLLNAFQRQGHDIEGIIYVSQFVHLNGAKSPVTHRFPTLREHERRYDAIQRRFGLHIAERLASIEGWIIDVETRELLEIGNVDESGLAYKTEPVSLLERAIVDLASALNVSEETVRRVLSNGKLLGSQSPAEAPEYWSDRSKGRKENVVEFIKRVYAPWLGKGLTQGDLYRLDMPLYAALSTHKRRHRLDLDLPERSQLAEQELKSLGIKSPTDAYALLTPETRSDPKALKEAGRLANAARRRAPVRSKASAKKAKPSKIHL